MNGISLFHGSDLIIEHPTPEGGKVHNDFGQGFYCTTELELAREWACSGKNAAFVNHYSLEPSSALSVCRLNSPEYHLLNWLALLLKNRRFEVREAAPLAIREYILSEFLPDLSGYDIIVGYRADDSYFSIASAFLKGSISLEELGEALRLGKLGEQYFLQSRRAFEALIFISFQRVDEGIYYSRRMKRDARAREAFRQINAKDKDWTEGVFALDIVRGKWKNDDERLR